MQAPADYCHFEVSLMHSGRRETLPPCIAGSISLAQTHYVIMVGTVSERELLVYKRDTTVALTLNPTASSTKYVTMETHIRGKIDDDASDTEGLHLIFCVAVAILPESCPPIFKDPCVLPAILEQSGIGTPIS